MEYRPLGSSGPNVSELGLGTNNFGSRLDASQTQKVVDTAIELGINLFDTADSYSAGVSEELLGRALGSRRKEVLIATKFGYPLEGIATAGGASSRWIHQAVNDNLRRLRTSWIDLYQVHIPDPLTPIGETLEALSGLVRDGKVRYLGTSNFSAWELVDADWTARTENLVAPIAAQYVWNLLEREVEATVLSAIRRLGLGLIVARPLAYGFLTGKYRAGQDVPGARLPQSKRADAFLTADNFEHVSQMARFAADCGHTMLELAFAHLLTEPQVSSVIASASSSDQLVQNVNSSGWRLGPDQRDYLEGLTAPVPRAKPLP